MFRSQHESSKNNPIIPRSSIYVNKQKQKNQAAFKEVSSKNLGEGLVTTFDEPIQPIEEKVIINAKDARGKFIYLLNLFIST